MKIEGIGVIKKEEIMSVFTRDGKEAIKAGEISMEEAAAEYKLCMVKKACKIGATEETFKINYDRIPQNLKNKLTPKELAELVEAFYKCHTESKKTVE